MECPFIIYVARILHNSPKVHERGGDVFLVHKDLE